MNIVILKLKQIPPSSYVHRNILPPFKVLTATSRKFVDLMRISHVHEVTRGTCDSLK